jgi:hypothetical protein
MDTDFHSGVSWLFVANAGRIGCFQSLLKGVGLRKKLFCLLRYLGYKKGAGIGIIIGDRSGGFKHLQKLFCWRSPTLVGLTLFFALLWGVFACITYWLVGYNSNGCHYRCSLFLSFYFFSCLESFFITLSCSLWSQ